MNDGTPKPEDAAHRPETAEPQEASKRVDLTNLNPETFECFFPSENQSSITIWFDRVAIDSLKEIARQLDCRLASLIRKAVNEFIEREGKQGKTV